MCLGSRFHGARGVDRPSHDGQRLNPAVGQGRESCSLGREGITIRAVTGGNVETISWSAAGLGSMLRAPRAQRVFPRTFCADPDDRSSSGHGSNRRRWRARVFERSILAKSVASPCDVVPVEFRGRRNQSLVAVGIRACWPIMVSQQTREIALRMALGGERGPSPDGARLRSTGAIG